MKAESGDKGVLEEKKRVKKGGGEVTRRDGVEVGHFK